MSEESLSTELSIIFRELVDHTKKRDEKINQRMETLADSITQSNVEISTLAKIVARSEERHLNQQEGLERLGNQLKESIDTQNTYMSNNDDRVMDVEKQNIELKIQGDNQKDKMKSVSTLLMGLISSVLSAALIAWIVIK